MTERYSKNQQESSQKYSFIFLVFEWTFGGQTVDK